MKREGFEGLWKRLQEREEERSASGKEVKKLGEWQDDTQDDEPMVSVSCLREVVDKAEKTRKGTGKAASLHGQAVDILQSTAEKFEKARPAIRKTSDVSMSITKNIDLDLRQVNSNLEEISFHLNDIGTGPTPDCQGQEEEIHDIMASLFPKKDSANPVNEQSNTRDEIYNRRPTTAQPGYSKTTAAAIEAKIVLTVKLKNMEEQLAVVKSERQKYQEQLVTTRDSLHESIKKVRSLESAAALNRKELQEANEVISSLRMCVTETAVQANTAKAERIILQGKLRVLSERFSRAYNKYLMASSEAEILSENHRSLNTEHSVLREAFLNLTTAHETITVKLTQTTEKLETETLAKEEYKSKHGKIKLRFNDLTQSRDALQDQLAITAEKLQISEAKREQELSAKTAELNEVTADLKRNQKLNQNGEGCLRALTEHLEEEKSKLRAAEEQTKTANEKLDHTTQEIVFLKSTVAKLTSTIQKQTNRNTAQASRGKLFRGLALKFCMGVWALRQVVSVRDTLINNLYDVIEKNESLSEDRDWMVHRFSYTLDEINKQKKITAAECKKSVVCRLLLQKTEVYAMSLHDHNTPLCLMETRQEPPEKQDPSLDNNNNNNNNNNDNTNTPSPSIQSMTETSSSPEEQETEHAYVGNDHKLDTGLFDRMVQGHLSRRVNRERHNDKEQQPEQTVKCKVVRKVQFKTDGRVKIECNRVQLSSTPSPMRFSLDATPYSYFSKRQAAEQAGYIDAPVQKYVSLNNWYSPSLTNTVKRRDFLGASQSKRNRCRPQTGITPVTSPLEPYIWEHEPLSNFPVTLDPAPSHARRVFGVAPKKRKFKPNEGEIVVDRIYT